MLRIGIRVPPCRPAPQVADYLLRVEKAGFDFAGLLDSQLLTRDVFVTMALAAQRTTRLGIFSAVTNPLTRHPSVLAGVALTVHEVAPGRIGIIIGSGYTAASTIGRKPATVDQMRQAVATVKRLLAGERVRFDGAESHLQFAGPQAPPVYMAATGPRMIELAGEVADGVLLAVGVDATALAAARRLLASGAARSGRRAEDLEVLLFVRSSVGDDVASVRRTARPLCAQWVMDGFRARWLREAGLDIPGPDDIPPELSSLYPDVVHAQDPEAAIRATAFLSDELVDQICQAIGLIGTPDYCRQRLTELARGGERAVYLMTLDTYSFPEQTVQSYERDILPQLRG